jgi:hypothetical protein
MWRGGYVPRKLLLAEIPMETSDTSLDESVWPIRKEMLDKLHLSFTVSLSACLLCMSTCSTQNRLTDVIEI